MKNFVKYLILFVLILGSITSECFPNSAMRFSSYYQDFNLKKSTELDKLKGAKFLFDTKHDVTFRFKISYDINPKYLNLADIISVLQYKYHSVLFHALKPILYKKLYLRAFFNSVYYTL